MATYAEAKIRRYKLVAQQSTASFSDSDTQTKLWLFNGVTPGPLIKAKKGETLEIEFHNNLNQPTTIHWHGIRNLNEMDGVPNLTQVAVGPGEWGV